MQFMLLMLVLLGYVALGQSSFNELPVHPGVGGLYKGPNSETIIKGPDGSVITAQKEGGSIVTQDFSQPIVVPDTLNVEPIQSIAPAISTVTATPVATVTATPVVAAAPVAGVLPETAAVPVVSVGHTVEIIQPDPHIIETEIVDAPIIEPQQSSDLIGPSGSISTRGSSSIVSGPASTTISEPAKVLVAAPLVAAVPIISTFTTPLRAIPVVEEAIDIPATPIGPTISSVTVGQPIATVTTSPQIFVSSTAPSIGIPASVSTVAPPLGVISTTIAPPLLVSTPASVESTNIGASIQPASSYGVINNLDNTASSTLRPDVIPSSTLTPLVKSTGGIVSTTPSTNLDLVNNRKLNINPSLIPSANIIPPEIGPLPPGAIDLGSTVTVSTFPRAPGLVSSTESPNIQRIDNSNYALLENSVKSDQQTLVQADGKIDQLATNQVILAGNEASSRLPPQRIPVPLLRDTNPIPVGIPQNGIVGTQLANYGIDSSQIGLTNVPLSSVSSLPRTIDQEIDDVSAQLWNRYGRDVEQKKLETIKKNNKEK